MKNADEIKKGLEYGAADCENCASCHYECPYVDVCSPYNHATNSDVPKELLADALALIQQLEAQVPRWISVEERMPEVGVDVSIIIEFGGYQYIRVGWMRKSGEWFQAGLGVVEGKVTHWAYLPEAPKEDAHE